MDEKELSLNDALAELWALRRREVLRLSVIRSLWVIFALCLTIFYIDSMAAISTGGRVLTLLGCIIVVVMTFVITSKWYNRCDDRQKMIARIIEKTNPEMNNSLINAVEFSERIERGDVSNVSRELMSSVIRLGISSLDEVEDFTSLSPETLVRERKIFIVAASVFALSAILFFSWFLTEVARFANPFGDHPPYSATKIKVDPKGAIVEYGDDLIVSAGVKGKVPKELTLVIREPGGDEISGIGMFNSKEGEYYQTIENVRTEIEYFVRFEGSRSKYFQIQLAKTPRIETVMAKYNYPEYTGIEGKSRVLIAGQSELKGYRDTEVTLVVESNRPLKDGTVKVGEKEYPARKSGENSVEATIPLKGKGKFSIVIRDVEGNLSTEKFAGDIRIVKDDEPTVSIVSPGMNSFAVPTAEVPVVIEAQDDLGVGKVRLFRRHNGSADNAKTVYDGREKELYVRTGESFDLADLGVRPGDIIDFYATVTDTLPDNPQSSASGSFKLMIISEEEYAKYMASQMTAKDMRQKYDRIFDEMKGLLDEQEKLDQQRKQLQEAYAKEAAKKDADFEDLKNKLAELAGRQEELSKKTEETAENLKKESESPAVFDIEKEYKKSLAKFSEKLNEARDHMQNASKSLEKSAENPSSCSGQLSDAAVEQGKAMAALGKQTEQEREKIAKANREIEKMMELLADVQMFNQLYLAQKHLSRQVWSYKQVESPDFEAQLRMKELGDDQQIVKEALAELKEKFREHGGKVREEYPKVADDADKIADEIESRQICEIMGQGREFLDKGNGMKGYPEVEDAHQQMKEMIKFCKSSGGKACENCEFRLQLKMSLDPGNTMQQMANSMSAGMGQGMAGAIGKGAAGFSGGQSNFAMFGNETFGENRSTKSNLVGTQKTKSKASANDERDALAGNVEELLEDQKATPEFEAEGDSRMMSEYGPVIEAYFRRLAEDE